MARWLSLCVAAALLVGCGDPSTEDKGDAKAVTWLPDEPVKLELKVAGGNRTLKYWVSSECRSGGDQTWKLPLKEVVIEVNLAKGSASLSARRWPFLFRFRPLSSSPGPTEAGRSPESRWGRNGSSSGGAWQPAPAEAGTRRWGSRHLRAGASSRSRKASGRMERR